LIRQSIARKYARGLFAVGAKDGKYREYLDQIDSVLSVFASEPRMKSALMLPLLEMERRKDILSDLSSVLGLSEPVAAFLGLLLENTRINYLSVIRETYSELADNKEGIVKGTAFTAYPLPDEAKSRVEEALGVRMSKKVRLDVKEDKELIGGIKVIIGGTMIDGSVKKQLELLNESLMKE
jgi:F-type H+-transporting ATPase subunit delta